MPRESGKWAKGSLKDGRGMQPYIPKRRLKRNVGHLIDLDDPIAYQRSVVDDDGRAKVMLTLRNRGELECPNCGTETDHILMKELTECMACGKRYKPEGYDER
jgi:DNA-directed RNA polymerase subunit RPC12/RpoP